MPFISSPFINPSQPLWDTRAICTYERCGWQTLSLLQQHLYLYHCCALTPLSQGSTITRHQTLLDHTAVYYRQAASVCICMVPYGSSGKARCHPTSPHLISSIQPFVMHLSLFPRGDTAGCPHGCDHGSLSKAFKIPRRRQMGMTEDFPD